MISIVTFFACRIQAKYIIHEYLRDSLKLAKSVVVISTDVLTRVLVDLADI